MRARVRSSSSERLSSTLAALAFALAGAFILWIAASSLSRAQPAAPGAGTTAPTLQAPNPNPAQPAPSLPSTGETLSERLDRSDGVIRPPPVGTVDPEIRVPPNNPNAGSNMPVIRPPGSPGGDPSVQPK